MDPTANDPFRYAGVADTLEQQASTETASAPIAPAVVLDAPIDGEILPPEAPAPQTVAAVIPQYPVGLIDFNLPIVVVDANDDETSFDTPSIVTVLRGSIHPVVVSFWKSGEQCIDQFNTDGESLSGDYTIEQDQPYPRTLFVVVGREGRKLVLDADLYSSEQAAVSETNLEEIAGVFPIVVQAKEQPVAEPIAEPVAEPILPPAGELGNEVEGDDIEDEEGDDEIEETDQQPAAVADLTQPPTEMYVAGRLRRVGDTVYASRKNFGVRECTVTKLRRDATKSLCLQPKDGTPAYWAWNSHVRY